MSFTRFVSIGIIAAIIFCSTDILCAPTDVDCARLKQDTLNLWLTVKDTCDDDVKDCCQVSKAANIINEIKPESGIFDIDNACSTGPQLPFLSHSQSITILQARCDLETDNGGWLVILRRDSTASPLVNFTHNWIEYENGFGDLNTEFWYGLKNIHCLTQRNDMELMIELKQNDGTGITWTYQTFSVDEPKTNYILHIGEAERIKGTGSDSMAYHNGQQFSTIDKDNDGWGNHCAANVGQGNGGGWWYNSCLHSALTRPHTGNSKIYWHSASPTYFPHVEMKIRPKSCH